MKSFSRSAVVIISVLALTGLFPTQSAAAVKIEHDAIKSATSGKRIALKAEVKDAESGVDLVRAYFKVEGESRYWFVKLNATEGDTYQGVMPAPLLGMGSVEYFLLVKNGADEVTKSQNFVIRVDDDQEALARLEQKPPRDVRVDLDDIEQVADATKQETVSEPIAAARVLVFTEAAGEALPKVLPGFDDYVVVGRATGAEALGVSSASSTTMATGTGIGTTGVVVGAVAAAAALGGGGGGGGGGSSGGSVISGTCGVSNTPGGDTAATYNIDVQQPSGTVNFTYDMQFVKDQMIVRYEGATVFDTGCVSGGTTQPINYSGSSTTITVEVIPNCEGTSGTAWSFSVSCP